MVSGTWRISGSPDLVILRITRFGHFLDPFLSTSWPSLTPFWPLPNTFKPTHYHFNHIPQIVVKYPLKRGSKRGSKRGQKVVILDPFLSQNVWVFGMKLCQKVGSGRGPTPPDGSGCTMHFLTLFGHFLNVRFLTPFFHPKWKREKSDIFRHRFWLISRGKNDPFFENRKTRKRGSKKGYGFWPPS